MKRKLFVFMLAFILILPFSFAIVGCKKNDAGEPEPNQEEETESYNYWDGTIQAVPEAQDGVVILTTAEQLAGLAKSVNEGNTYEGVTIKLAVNINLKNIEWTPIGYGDCNYVNSESSRLGPQFMGTFDGQNNTIYNLKITSFNKGGVEEGTAAGVGLFGQLLGTVKNVKIIGADVVGNHFVGVVTGYALNATISNCSVESARVSCVYKNENNESGDKAGAVVGHIAKGLYSEDSALVENCSAKNCTVAANRDAGQVIGCVSNGAVNTNNSAEAVTVSCNSSDTTPKHGQNITNDVVGRLA